MAELSLIRREYTNASTIGDLLIDGTFFCYTLEDTCRRVKVDGKTAIPAGRYEVILSWSKRFGRTMPLLLNVPYFEGIRIHNGNTADSTDGCILVGKTKAADFIGESRAAFAGILFRLGEIVTKEKVFINVVGGISADQFKAAA